MRGKNVEGGMKKSAPSTLHLCTVWEKRLSRGGGRLIDMYNIYRLFVFTAKPVDFSMRVMPELLDYMNF